MTQSSILARPQSVALYGGDAFLASPALARARDGGGAAGTTWLAYLQFDGDAERVRLARSGDGVTWSEPLDVSPAGTVYPPAVAASGDTVWTCWVARDAAGDAGDAGGAPDAPTGPAAPAAQVPAEEAVFALWARAAHADGIQGEPVRLAGDRPFGAPGRRPYRPAACAGPDGGVWLVHEVWDTAAPALPAGGTPAAGAAAAVPVRLELRCCRAGEWGAPVPVPAPPDLPAAGAPRMYDPAVAAGADGQVHVVWWSPNDGEPWDAPGTRPGTTAGALRDLDPTARAGRDGGATGSDVWYARYDGAAWTGPERLNLTASWHLHPSVAVDGFGWVWVSWATLTRIEHHGALNSDIPYVQTGAARSRRAPWFREARPVVRVLDVTTGTWHTAGAEPQPDVPDGLGAGPHSPSPSPTKGEGVSNPGARWPEGSAPSSRQLEPGMVWSAGHTLYPQIVCTAASGAAGDGGGGIALLIRRYGENQAASLNTGEGRARLRAFDAALAWLTPGGWSETQPLHDPAHGGILATAAAISTEDGVLVAWQGDAGTRNARSTICVAHLGLEPEATVAKGGTRRRGSPAPWRSLEERAAQPTSSGFEEVAGGSSPESAQPQAPTTAQGGGPYFGNIHMHTEQSFCRRATSHLLDFNYRWAQDCMRQDFAVLTDHAETKSAYEWWLNRKAAAFYTTPCFAAILGYEWTTRYDAETGRANGHVDVYFRGDPPRFWPANAKETSTLPGLWEVLERGEAAGYPAITAAHHPPVTSFRRSWALWGGDRLEPVVEIHQDRRGSFERRGCVGGGVLPAEQLIDGHFVSDALAQGYTLGFVSGGDHMGISMTAVFADALTREAIFDAIRARRCYAVTGARIRVDLSVDVGGRNGGMGEVVPVAGGGDARFTAHVDAPSPVARLVLVRNSQDVYAVAAPPAALDASLAVRPGDYCYVRVELADGELAWTSPVFFRE